jgi:hypothetical protein
MLILNKQKAVERVMSLTTASTGAEPEAAPVRARRRASPRVARYEPAPLLEPAVAAASVAAASVAVAVPAPRPAKRAAAAAAPVAEPRRRRHRAAATATLAME